MVVVAAAAVAEAAVVEAIDLKHLNSKGCLGLRIGTYR